MSLNLNDIYSVYTINNLIEVGGFGKVFRGKSIHNGREVAIKQIENKKVILWCMVSSIKQQYGHGML